jgi:hypothetical protein
MWTRFFPAVKKARELIAAGAIGEPVLFQADFGFCGNPKTQDRVFNPALGGGALLDIGIYPIAAASLCFRCSAPVEVKAVGTLGASGVDEIGSLALQVGSWLHAWPRAQANKHAHANKHRHQCAAQQIKAVGLQASHHHPRPLPLHSHSHTHTYTHNHTHTHTPHTNSPTQYPGGGSATIGFTLRAQTPEEATYIGSKGYMRLASPSHAPTKLILVTPLGRSSSKEEVFEFPLPENKGPALNFPSSEGFQSVVSAQLLLLSVLREAVRSRACCPFSTPGVSALWFCESARVSVQRNTFPTNACVCFHAVVFALHVSRQHDYPVQPTSHVRLLNTSHAVVVLSAW